MKRRLRRRREAETGLKRTRRGEKRMNGEEGKGRAGKGTRTNHMERKERQEARGELERMVWRALGRGRCRLGKGGEGWGRAY